MAKRSYSVTSTGLTSLGRWYRPRMAREPRATIAVEGTFGGTSLALQYKKSSGSVYQSVRDAAGNPVTFSSAGSTNIELFSDPEDPVELFASCTGGTGISITVDIFDQR